MSSITGGPARRPALLVGLGPHVDGPLPYGRGSEGGGHFNLEPPS